MENQYHSAKRKRTRFHRVFCLSVSGSDTRILRGLPRKADHKVALGPT